MGLRLASLRRRYVARLAIARPRRKRRVWPLRGHRFTSLGRQQMGKLEDIASLFAVQKKARS
jgi:hypothetical protein